MVILGMTDNSLKFSKNRPSAASSVSSSSSVAREWLHETCTHTAPTQQLGSSCEGHGIITSLRSQIVNDPLKLEAEVDGGTPKTRFLIHPLLAWLGSGASSLGGCPPPADDVPGNSMYLTGGTLRGKMKFDYVPGARQGFRSCPRLRMFIDWVIYRHNNVIFR